MTAAWIVVPLVALVFPIVLVIGALLFDALYMSTVAYRLWHDRAPGQLRRLLHRSP